MNKHQAVWAWIEKSKNELGEIPNLKHDDIVCAAMLLASEVALDHSVQGLQVRESERSMVQLDLCQNLTSSMILFFKNRT